MTRLRLFGALCAALVIGVIAPAASSADPSGNVTCSSGDLAGTYQNVTITGFCTVEDNATLEVRGNLTLDSGSVFDAVTMARVTIKGNVYVGSGATFGLGCTVIGVGCPGDTHDTVDGSVYASGALTMYLDGDKIKGDVLSAGGGPGVTWDPYTNFVIKDNTIGGNVAVDSWHGTWLGLIRNTVRGTVSVTNNQAIDPDSTEIATNTVFGDLVCSGNTPAAQLGDSGGLPNTVHGQKLGECAGL